MRCDWCGDKINGSEIYECPDCKKNFDSEMCRCQHERRATASMLRLGGKEITQMDERGFAKRAERKCYCRACPSCNGTGSDELTGGMCSECGGSGDFETCAYCKGEE